MHVDAHISRSDLVLFNLYLLPRAKTNRVFVSLLTIVLFVLLVGGRSPCSWSDYVRLAAIALAGGIGSLLIGVLISMTFIMFNSKVSNGVLGLHSYAIAPDGVSESTAVNTTTQKWVAVQELGRSQSYIYFRVSGFLFYLIPRRAFPTQDAYEEFWRLANEYWSARAA